MKYSRESVPLYQAFRSVDSAELTEREKTILRSIVHGYILTANPIGSRVISKQLEHELGLSAATIRNVMSDLEAMGFITHPHTSAGRMPTDKGYRYYVESLMPMAESLAEQEVKAIYDVIQPQPDDKVLRAASKILGSLSHYLGLVQLPSLSDSVIRKIELLELSSRRLLVVIALNSDIVRTITLESDFEISDVNIAELALILNERISGRTINFVRTNLSALLQDTVADDAFGGLVRVFVDNADTLFAKYSSANEKVHIAGAPNLLEHREFVQTENFRGIIELIESQEIVVHLLESVETHTGSIRVIIGDELPHSTLQEYALVTTNYRMESAAGTIGIIGPKRMNYAKMFAIIQQVAGALSS